MTDVPPHLTWLHARHGSALSSALAERDGVDLSPGAAIAALAAADPTPGLRLTDWLVRTYVDKDTFRFEDVRGGRESTVGTTLASWVARRGGLPPERRNINLYDSPGALWRAVGGDVPSKPSKRAERDRARAESRILLEDERGIVAVPLTEFAACWWGRGTRWCTAAAKDNAFEYYAKRGPLFVLVLPGGEKKQLHVSPDRVDLKDAADDVVDNESLQTLHELLDPVIQWAVDVNGMALALSSGKLRDDRETVLRAVRNSPMAATFANVAQRDDFDVMTAAVRGEGAMLEIASHRLRNHRNLVLEAVRQDGAAIRFASYSLRADRALVLEAVRTSPDALAHASGALRSDREVVMEAVTHHGVALSHASSKIRNDRDIVLAAVASDGQAITHASEDLQEDSDVAVAAVTARASAILQAPARFRDHRGVVLAAVTCAGTFVHWASTRLKADPEIVAAALANDGLALQFLDPTVSDDRASVLAAVSSAGIALKYVSGNLRCDPDVALAAIAQDPSAFEFADTSLQLDPGFVLAAVSMQGNVLSQVASRFRHDREIVMAAVPTSVTPSSTRVRFSGTIRTSSWRQSGRTEGRSWMRPRPPATMRTSPPRR